MSAPEHHPLCFKDGCLGVDGGCCLAAYVLGDAARHAQNMADFERLRGHAKNDATMYRNTIEAQAIEIERLKKESAAHWNLARDNGADVARLAAKNDEACAEIGRLQKIVEGFGGRRNATPDALDRLRHAAAEVCNSEGIPLDDDMVEVRADRLSELRKEIDNGAAVAAEAARITDLRRAARSVVQAWQVDRADKFSADWHAEFRCLENALRAFPNPIPKEPR